MLSPMSELRRSLIRKLEHIEAFPLIGLQAARELRADLDQLEGQAILRARKLGASLEDIADAMGITRQGVAYRIKQLSNGDTNGGEQDHVVDLAAEEPERPEVR